MELRKPSRVELPSYVAALERGWWPDNVGRAEAAARDLRRIEEDADGFLASFEDRAATGGPITLPDGSVVARLPGFRRWMWDGEVCGTIGFRWVNGTSKLPPHVLGHIGYSVPEWHRRKGYASAALRLLLPEAQALGLDYVELTTDPDNIASQKVITGNGGTLVGPLHIPAYGDEPHLLFRIMLG